MKNKLRIFIKTQISIMLASIIFASSMDVNMIYAKENYDEVSLLEQVANEYKGTSMASSRLETIGFRDVQNGHWAKESIARAGALELIKGWDDQFFPNKNVSRAESLAIMIRLMGRNSEAEKLTKTITEKWDTKNINMKDLWAIGAMQIARDLNFISSSDYTDAMYPNQAELHEGSNFIMGNGATRAEIAEWMCKTLEKITNGNVAYDFHYSNIYSFKDWNSIPEDKRVYVDYLKKAEIMVGSDGYFKPNTSITRAEMAKVLENLDNAYYQSEKVRLTKKVGYVANILDDAKPLNDINQKARYIYIRSANGTIDRLYVATNKNNINQKSSNEVVVYKDGRVTNTSCLEKGDEIEYLVNDQNEVIYISVADNKVEQINATLYDTRNIANGTIVLKLDDGSYYDGILKSEVYNPQTDELLIDNTKYKMDSLPFTTKYKFTVKGNVITKIDYLGEEKLFEEIRGIVKEINLPAKSITVYDENANIITKYWQNDVEVEKQEYYESSDEVGYIDEVFKEYMFDKMDSVPSNIEPGDTVYIRFKDDGSIRKIDVGTNYGVKYGKIKSIDYKGVLGTSLTLSYDDESSESLALDEKAIIKKNGSKTNIAALTIGDQVRILYNRGVINPSNVVETIKQVNVSNVEKQITDIMKGELIYYDPYQGVMNFSNVEKLDSAGWSDFINVKPLKLARNCQFYDEDKRVSLDYIKEFMVNHGTAYMGISKNFGEDEVVKLTFRDSREQVLAEDNVNYAKGNGEFKLTSDASSLIADSGTIIRRYGRIVDKESITSPDLAKVVLNGNRKCAVVDINEEVSNNEIGIFRAKIKSLKERTSFEVYSFSKLQGMEWSYMPLERNFEINSRTDIYQGGNKIMYYDFLDYTDNSQIDNIYTIFTLGDEAIMLTDIPYTKAGISGEVYKTDGTNIDMKNVVSFNETRKVWEDISSQDKTLSATLDQNAVIIKNNEIVDSSVIKKGDKVKILGIDDGYQVKKNGGTYTGYIVLIER